VNGGAVDVDGDGVSEVLTEPALGLRSKTKVRIFRKEGTLTRQFQIYPDHIRFGAEVSNGRIGE
jgi:hypothetical protein